jgi:hypothetical protein
MNRLILAIVAPSIALSGGPVYAESTTAAVPAASSTSRPCEASLGAPVREGNIIVLGQVKELCSSGRGYRLVLNHPEGLGGARFVTGSRTIILSDGRETLIADESGARRRSGPARIELDQVPTRALAFSIAIAPK